MNLSENLQQAIDHTDRKLLSESNLAQRRFLAFEGLTNELRYLQQHPVIAPRDVAAVAQRPNVDDLTLEASYPTPWPDLYLKAITAPTHFNVNLCLTVTAMQITPKSGLPQLPDAHLIPAIIRTLPNIHTDVLRDNDSTVELAATIGRSAINAQHLPPGGRSSSKTPPTSPSKRSSSTPPSPSTRTTSPSSTATTSAASCPPPARPRN